MPKRTTYLHYSVILIGIIPVTKIPQKYGFKYIVPLGDSALYLVTAVRVVLVKKRHMYLLLLSILKIKRFFFIRKHMKEKIPYENLERGRQFLVILFLFVSLWYLTWRLGTFNKNALIFSWLLYGAELYGFFTTIMHMFMTWRLTIRVPPDPREGATVDVFIPTFNEPVALLRKTLLAAKHIDYPHQTWLLDDGNRQEMENLAKELGCQYLCRTDNSEAKAGNLNNALLHSSAEFIAIFDADHAPKKNFLSRTLGYFTDQLVAFVQTPQDFYNLDSFQHHKKGNNAEAWHEQTVFFRVIQRGKDYWNAAFFCGSCAIIRRSSLDEIGGFATGTVTEDLHTSLKLHKKGFRSVFHAEPLAFGLAPSGVQAFLKQRIRWETEQCKYGARRGCSSAVA